MQIDRFPDEEDAAWRAGGIRGRDDHGDASQPGIGLDPGVKLVAVQLGHDQVEHDDARWIGLSKRLEPLEPVGGAPDAIALILECISKGFSDFDLVLDDENRARLHSKGPISLAAKTCSTSAVSARGSSTRNRVRPSLGVDSTWIRPPCAMAICCEMKRPRPRPLTPFRRRRCSAPRN